MITIICLSDRLKNLTNDCSNLIAWTIAWTLGRPIDQLTNLKTNHNLKYWPIYHSFKITYVAINDDVYHHWWPCNGLSAYVVNLPAVDGVSNMHAKPCYAQIVEKILFSIFLDIFCKTDFESETKRANILASKKS